MVYRAIYFDVLLTVVALSTWRNDLVLMLQ